ncbi:hypothetical protein U1Q18_024265 [Sarracenia purpurea var. burkii]
MATCFFSRSLLTSKHAFSSIFSRSYTSLSVSSPPSSLSSLFNSSLLRLRPLAAVTSHFHLLSPSASSVRGFSTRKVASSLNDPNPNWSNRPPKETILLDGCDFEHWLVVMEKPEGDPTRDEIIDSYIKTLASVVGSEEEARMKIYSVSTRHYFAFGALVSEELSYKLKELPKVRWVLPDSYLDVRNKDYGGEPFINGQAVPYDPKYHEEWVRNNAKANERNRRNDRPRNFDRSRNFERRRENMQNRDFQQNPGSNMPPPGNMGGAPNMGGGMPQNNSMGGGVPPPNSMGGGVPPNMGGGPNMGGMGARPPYNMGGGVPPNMGGAPNMGGGMGGVPPNMGGAPNMGGMPQNMGRVPYNAPNNMPPNNIGGGVPYNPPNNMPPNNMGGGVPYNPPNNMPPNNMGGGVPSNHANFQHGGGSNSGGGVPFGNSEMPGGGQNREYQHSHGPPNASGGNPYQTQNLPGRDMPPPPNYQ